MNAAIRDKAIGRRLARHGMRVTRSDRQPYPFERLARYRAAAAAISADTFCTVTGVQPGRPAVSPCDDALLAPSLPASGQQAPFETPGNVAISSALKHRATDSRERPAPITHDAPNGAEETK